VKYIFVTVGVVSSWGKGLTAAALGALLEMRGLTVRIQKFDPYLNVDPGTMSPFQHGEVYVLEDGAELVANLRRETDPYEVYREAKLAWKLSRAQLAVLRELCAWRELEARARDLPRNRIVSEH